jgi:hypothetical protein
MSRSLARGFAGLLLALVVQAGRADFSTYSFYNITNNGNADLSGQLQMTVSSVANPQQTLFRFTNLIGIPSSICDVYFDDGALLGIASVSGSPGVSFSVGASPGNLPGGNSISPPFETSAPNEWFATDSDSPVFANGVNSASEYLDILFNLQTGMTYANVVSSLADGSLRVGLHMQAIGATGGSDSYVNGGGDGVVPAPAAVSLGLIGLGLVHLVRRTRG